jgi:hypothetical protein
MTQTNRWIAVRYGDHISATRDDGSFGIVERPDEHHILIIAPDEYTALEMATTEFARLDIQRWNEQVRATWHNGDDAA